MTAHQLPFADLTPETIMGAVESLGHVCDGRLLPLNSYENRVWQVGIEEGTPLIAKFYRKGRWTDAQIHEELSLVLEYAAHELPVVAPLEHAGRALHHHAGYRFALFPRQGGHAPDLESEHHLRALGRVLGRMHRIGAATPFAERPAINIESFGHEPAAWIATHCIPAHLEPAYVAVTGQILAVVAQRFAEVPVRSIRAHADFHPGNILWRDGHPHLVDFDDARMAPAVQDLWMLMTGTPQEQRRSLGWLLEGYLEFHEFDRRELHLIESLRALRMIHYSAWLARRADEPAFQSAFPWFGTAAYWEGHVLELKEQLGWVMEPPLFVDNGWDA